MTKPVEIAIVSGKGGTGKTVLASSLAALIDDSVVADCDVDAPDLHLLLSPTVRKREAFQGAKVAAIDPAGCTVCGKCLEVCRYGAIKNGDAGAPRAYSVDELACEGCGVCAWMCPEKAIALNDSVGGEWYVSDTRFGPMVHARLAVAQENSGRLVTIVRSEARKIGIERGHRFVLIDGPPGIGCPVIASIAGADLAIVVTEPTRSGIHDLERIVGLTRHFGLRTAAVINKYDLNHEISNDEERFLAEQGVPLLGEIPFGSEVNKAIAAGEVVVEFSDGDVAWQVRRVGIEVIGMFLEDAQKDTTRRR